MAAVVWDLRTACCATGRELLADDRGIGYTCERDYDRIGLQVLRPEVESLCSKPVAGPLKDLLERHDYGRLEFAEHLALLFGPSLQIVWISQLLSYVLR
jgi:hypothetical protein